MKYPMFLISGLICLLTVFCAQHVEAGFSNSGRMQSKNLNISVGGTLDNNGELIGSETATLSCDTLSGKGLIRSPQMTIKAKIFAYTGTIDCTGKCTIISSTPFDEKIFKREGKGEYIIVIDENFGKQTQVHMHATTSLNHIDYEISDELQMSVE